MFTWCQVIFIFSLLRISSVSILYPFRSLLHMVLFRSKDYDSADRWVSDSNRQSDHRNLTSPPFVQHIERNGNRLVGRCSSGTRLVRDFKGDLRRFYPRHVRHRCWPVD